MNKNNILEKLKTTRILAAIGVAGLILGTVTPFFSYSFLGYSYSMSLWHYWEGKIVMLLAIVNLLFIFKDFVEKYIPSLFNTNIGKKIRDLDNAKYSLIPTILSAILIIYLSITVDFELDILGIGFYILWIGVICLVAYAILNRKRQITDNSINTMNTNNGINQNNMENQENQNFGENTNSFNNQDNNINQ